MHTYLLAFAMCYCSHNYLQFICFTCMLWLYCEMSTHNLLSLRLFHCRLLVIVEELYHVAAYCYVWHYTVMLDCCIGKDHDRSALSPSIIVLFSRCFTD